MSSTVFNSLSEHEKQIYMESLQKAVMNNDVCFEAGLEIIELWNQKANQSGPTT